VSIAGYLLKKSGPRASHHTPAGDEQQATAARLNRREVAERNHNSSSSLQHPDRRQAADHRRGAVDRFQVWSPHLIYYLRCRPSCACSHVPPLLCSLFLPSFFSSLLGLRCVLLACGLFDCFNAAEPAVGLPHSTTAAQPKRGPGPGPHILRNRQPRKPRICTSQTADSRQQQQQQQQQQQERAAPERKATAIGCPRLVLALNFAQSVHALQVIFNILRPSLFPHFVRHVPASTHTIRLLLCFFIWSRE
jgi:hypothetical protein